jgi:hypothetical protein
MSVKETINTVFAKLPFKVLAEKIPAEARTKVPLLNKAIPFANQIVCGLAVVLLVTVIACSGKGGSSGGGASSSRSNAKASPVSDFSYDLTDDKRGIKITGYTGKGGAVVIPSTIEDMPVLELWGGAFYARQEKPAYNITSIVIPNGVEVIGVNVFYSSRITSINIPNSVKSIGANAFRESNITSIVIPNGVESIGSQAFKQMQNLTKVTLPDNVILEGEAFSFNRKLTSINLTSNLNIGYEAFRDCSELTDIVIPSEISNVKFSIPGGLTVNGAFKGCGKLPIKTRQRLQELGYTGEF